MLARDLLGAGNEPAAQPTVLRLALAFAADLQRRAVDMHLANHGAAGQLGEERGAGLPVVRQRQAQEGSQPVVGGAEAEEVLLGDTGVIDEVVQSKRAAPPPARPPRGSGCTGSAAPARAAAAAHPGAGWRYDSPR